MQQHQTTSTLPFDSTKMMTKTLIIYIFHLISFCIGAICEFYLVHEFMSLEKGTFIFFILLFENLATIPVIWVVFSCIMKFGIREKINSRIEFVMISIEALLYFSKNTMKLFAMLFIGLQLMAVSLPWLYFIFIIINSLSPRLFDQYQLRYFNKKTIIAFLLTFVTSLVLFAYNDFIRNRALGLLFLFLWISFEALETWVVHIIQFSLIDFTHGSSKFSLFGRRLHSTSSTIGIESVGILPNDIENNNNNKINVSKLETQISTTAAAPAEVQVATRSRIDTTSDTPSQNFTYLTMAFFNSLYGVAFSLAGIFLVEIDSYSIFFEDDQGDKNKILGTTFPVIGIYVFTMIFFIKYMMETTRLKRVVDDISFKAILIAIFVYPIFSQHTNITTIVDFCFWLIFIGLFIILKRRSFLNVQKNELADSMAPTNSANTTTTS